MGSFVDRATEPADLESMLLAIRQISRERADLIAAARVGRLGHWTWDFDRDEVIASDELCRLHGLVSGALDGSLEDFLAHVHFEDRSWTKQILRTASSTRRPFDHVHRIVRDDGAIRMLEIRAEIDSREDGQPARLQAVSVDVTDAVASRQELEDDVAFYRRVIESLPEGVVALDQGHRVVACNRRLAELCGFGARIAVGVSEAELAEALGARLADGAPPAAAAPDDAAEPTARELLRLVDGRVIAQRRTHTPERTPLSVWSFRDETERQAAAARTACLAQLGRLLSCGRLEERIEHAARVAMPLLGQVCAVDRVVDGEAVRVVEVRSAPDVDLEPPGELMAADGTEIRSGQGRARSRLAVPLVRRGLRHGTLSFARPVGGKPFGTDDLAFAREVADRLALVIEEAEAHLQAQDTILECERLLSIAGHELRGPVTALQLSVQSLMRRGDLDPVTTRHVEVIERASRRMTRLINQLLDLGRIRSGQWTVELEPVDLCDLARNVARFPPADAPQPEVAIRVEATRPSVVGRWDRSSLEQILSNLVGNAIKFGRGRAIEIRVGADDRQAWLAVRDHGIGIDREQQALIFEPFKRAPGVQHVGGLGLGLHIVRTIVTRLGGDIRVESKPGEGATFVVSLPFLPAGVEGAS